VSDTDPRPDEEPEDVLELEVPDPGTLPGEGPLSAPAGGGEEGPYRNLLVPLVVVPALIIMVAVALFTFFLLAVGSEDSPRENLEQLLNGGFKDRQQAAFSLVRQVLEYEHARAEGRDPEWDIDPSFLPELKRACEQQGEPEDADEVTVALVLSSLLAQMGEPQGVYQLIDLTGLDATLDPRAENRIRAIWTLGAIGADLQPAERTLAARALIALLEDPDPAVVLVSAAGLQNLPTEATVPALQGLLESPSLELRGTAALSLAQLGDPAGAPVLRAMTTFEPYEREHAADRAKWSPKRVSESRLKALGALATLGLAPEPAALGELAENDPDGQIRAAARELLERPHER